LDTKKKISSLYFVPAGLWAAIIMVVCLLSPSYIPVVEFDLLSPDKIAHAALFGFLCLLLQWGISKNGFLNYKNMFWLTFLTVVYGAIIELLQMVSRNGRQADVDDILANGFGALMVYLCYIIYYRSLIRKSLS